MISRQDQKVIYSSIVWHCVNVPASVSEERKNKTEKLNEFFYELVLFILRNESSIHVTPYKMFSPDNLYSLLKINRYCEDQTKSYQITQFNTRRYLFYDNSISF